MPEKTSKLEDLSSLTVVEATELAKMLEEKWGISAAAAASDPGGNDGVAGSGADENTEFTVVLATAGDKKVEVVREVRAITGLGLKEAQDLVERAPTVLSEGITKSEAGREHAQLSSVGAQTLLVRGISPRVVAGGDEPFTSWQTSAGDPPRRPVTNFRQEAESLGISVAPEPDRLEAAAIVRKIAANSSDLFPDEGAARLFLFDHPIDGSGKTAVELVQERGAAALLIKLDQMRFGTSG